LWRQGQTAENQRPWAIRKTKGTRRWPPKTRFPVRADPHQIPAVWQNRAVTGQKFALNQSGASRVLTTNRTVVLVKIISFEKFFVINKLFNGVILYSPVTLCAPHYDYQ
jgi:hypothetical protein